MLRQELRAAKLVELAFVLVQPQRARDVKLPAQLRQRVLRAVKRAFGGRLFHNAMLLDEILEVRNVENNYIVNVKNLNDIEIFLVGGIKIRNDICYTDQQILQEYNDIFAGRQSR